jgi:hypothetical protein
VQGQFHAMYKKFAGGVGHSRKKIKDGNENVAE